MGRMCRAGPLVGPDPLPASSSFPFVSLGVVRVEKSPIPQAASEGFALLLGTRKGSGAMAVADLAFKALTAGLGVATLYLAGTFSVNVYRGLAWHSEQSVSRDPQSRPLPNPARPWPGPDLGPLDFPPTDSMPARAEFDHALAISLATMLAASVLSR